MAKVINVHTLVKQSLFERPDVKNPPQVWVIYNVNNQCVAKFKLDEKEKAEAELDKLNGVIAKPKVEEKPAETVEIKPSKKAK